MTEKSDHIMINNEKLGQMCQIVMMKTIITMPKRLKNNFSKYNSLDFVMKRDSAKIPFPSFQA